MVFKKKDNNQNHKPINSNDSGGAKGSTTNDNSTKEVTLDSVKSDLTKLTSKIDLETIKAIDSEKDLSTKKKDKAIKKIYPYWVYIFKNGKRIKDFGVREEDFNGIKLLIRTEKINDETRVVFRELFPEPRFDANIVDANKQRLSKELNLLKQIEKELESELFEKGETNEYNYDLADVRLAILEKEILLESIKYGKTFRYFQDIRSDGIPCLFYEFENNGLKLKKEVKEKSLFAEASEIKQIESLESKRDIDEHLKKKDERDWKKIAWYLIGVFLTLVATYGVFELLDYNHERDYGEVRQELEKTMVIYNNGIKAITTQCGINENSEVMITMTQILKTNQELLNSCINGNLIETNKPTIES